MSCLPDIFTSRSQPLPHPAKIGGVYSIHLATSRLPKPHIPSKHQPNATQRIFSRSLGNKNNKTWREIDNSLRKSQWTRRSFYGREEAIEEKEVGVENINGRSTQQIEIEAVSNFNQVKRTALQGVHLAQRSLQISAGQCRNIRRDLNMFRQRIEDQLSNTTIQMNQAFAQLLAQFRMEKRNTLQANKTVHKQLNFLAEDTQTVRLLANESEQRFGRVTGQFM